MIEVKDHIKSEHKDAVWVGFADEGKDGDGGGVLSVSAVDPGTAPPSPATPVAALVPGSWRQDRPRHYDRLVCRWNVKELKFQTSWGLIVHERDNLLFFGQLQKV